ncbi:MAG: electron transfer flavoprotein subunit beta/FixA family protein [Chloroflexi bacterium]|nr:electron transfer flavoprotein subunit beta/FixA family protein [Chloroflexota bacterium]
MTSSGAQLKILVCVKQVIDPETPLSAFKIDPGTKRVAPAAGVPPVVNGFDENAVEAALRLKDSVGAEVTVLSMSDSFAMDVMKKPLSMGADALVLAQDSQFRDLDPFASAYVLAAAIRKLDGFDLILCGRQASDWDNAQVPTGIAEMLGLPLVTVAQKLDLASGGIVVERALPDGYEVVEAPLPALVTVSNELGEPRYPTLRGIMAAGKKTPTTFSASDLEVDPARLAPRMHLLDLAVPPRDSKCEFISGENEADTGRQLALRLREAKLI